MSSVYGTPTLIVRCVIRVFLKPLSSRLITMSEPDDLIARAESAIAQINELQVLTMTASDEVYPGFSSPLDERSGFPVDQFLSRLGAVSDQLQRLVTEADLFADAASHLDLARKMFSLRKIYHQHLDQPQYNSSEYIIPQLGGGLYQLFELVDWVNQARPQETTSLIAIQGKEIQESGIVLVGGLAIRELVYRLGPDALQWYQLGPRTFEEVLSEIWSGLGWETLLTPPSKDGGFDVRAIRNEHGLILCYLIEAKAYHPSNPVGVHIVRRMIGTVEMHRATHGIIATTSRFTAGAQSESKALQYRLTLANFGNVLHWLERYKQLQRR